MNLLLSGLDTIECAYYLSPSPSGSEGKGACLDFETLRLQREEHRQSKSREPMILQLGGTEFALSANGTRSGYPFLITNRQCAIQFGEFNDPSFFVTYRSEALWHKGAKALHEEFLAWAASIGWVPHKPEGLSRCDFAFDFHLPVVDFDEDSFVTLAEKDSQHRKNRRVQTFTFGRDEVVLRVYNKSDEVNESSGKFWLHPLWGGQAEDVWRVEWQVRKDTLKRFSLRTFDDLFDGYGDLLRYLVSEHTSLRVKTEDSNSTRWPIHPLWALLAQHIDTLPAQGVYRALDDVAALDERLLRLAISVEGYLKQIAAIECLKEGRPMLSHSQTIDRLLDRLQRVHNNLTWRTDVGKRIEKARVGA